MSKKQPSVFVWKLVNVQRPVAASSPMLTPLTSRRSSTLSSNRFASFPCQSSKFKKNNHTAIFVFENADPNVLISASRLPPVPHDAAMLEIPSLVSDSSGKMLMKGIEPRISGDCADSIISSLGFLSSHRIEAAGFSGGLWLCWCDIVCVKVLQHHFQFMHCHVTCLDSEASSLVTLVYASPTMLRRKALWPHLRNLASPFRAIGFA
ncbi:hypothetical protein V6N13_064686 [Hibiscus sabdariffa]